MASGILLIAHVISCSLDDARQDATEEALVVVNEETRSNWFGRKIIQRAHCHGGPVIFGFKIARLIGCLTLFSISIATLLLCAGDSGLEVFLLDNLPQTAMYLTFVSHCNKSFI